MRVIAALDRSKVLGVRFAFAVGVAVAKTSQASVWSWAWQVLGLLLGIATVVSIIKSGFDIQLYGLAAKVYQQYAWLRDLLFEPIVLVLHYLGLTFPWWLKDTIMSYGLIAGTHWRMFRGSGGYSDLPVLVTFDETKLLRSVDSRTGDRLVPTDAERARWAMLSALSWPIFHLRVWILSRRIGDVPYFEFSKENARDSQGRPLPLVIGHFPEKVAAFVRAFRLLVAWNLAVIVTCTVAFFLWNYLSNRFGPPG